jgi:hypothetical protein
MNNGQPSSVGAGVGIISPHAKSHGAFLLPTLCGLSGGGASFFAVGIVLIFKKPIRVFPDSAFIIFPDATGLRKGKLLARDDNRLSLRPRSILSA